VNFWLPIPIGGGCYLSLRIESVHGFRQRIQEVRNVASTTTGEHAVGTATRGGIGPGDTPAPPG